MATRVNASGLSETVAANAPRFDYDPVTLALKGLLIEEVRTNLLLRSAEFDNAAWVKSTSGTGSAAVVVPNAAVAPDGTTTADKVTFSLNGGTLNSDISILIQSGFAATTYSGSFYIRADAPVRIAARVGPTWHPVDVTTTWQRISLTPAEVADNIQIGLRGQTVSGLADSATVYLWGAQLEAGAFPTSYIPTTTASVTRNADLATLLTSLIAGFDGSAMTLYAEASQPVAAANRGIITVNDGTANERIDIRSSLALVTDGGVAQASVAFTNISTTATKLALAIAANDVAVYRNGVSAGTDASATLPTVTTLRIGNLDSGIQQLSGHIRKIRIYNRRLTNAELLALTS